MRNLCIIAAAAAAIALGLTGSPAMARCADDDASCTPPAEAAAAPMKLNQFMQTWKPVAEKKRVKKSKTVRARSKKAAEPQVAKTAPSAVPGPARVVQTEPVWALAAGALEAGMLPPATAPEEKVQTDGVGITSADDVNELDAAADKVQVVASNDVNEIDLAAPAAPPAPPAQETVGQSFAAPEQVPADNSWVGKLLLAVAGTIALAGAARFLIA